MTIPRGDIWDQLGEAWDPERPPKAATLARALTKLGFNLPLELAALYARADGGTLGRIDIFTLKELIDANAALRRRPQWTSTIFFGSDGADGFFGIDTEGRVGAGPGAIVWVDRGMPLVRMSVPSGPDFAWFLKSVAAGETPWLAPTFSERAIARMRAALKEAGSNVERREGADFNDVHDVGLRVGVGLPEELKELLQLSNGLKIGGVKLYGIDEISAVPGAVVHDMPGALWIGEDDKGDRYALTMISWREPEGGVVLRLKAGEPPEAGEILGPLTEVVTNWIKRAA
jgi:cell wall assembly regulator SMI1